MIHLLSYAAASLLCIPTIAIAQSSWARFSLSWTEVDSTTNIPVPNPNGALEPGEAARVAVTVAFTPVGTIHVPGQSIAGFADVGLQLDCDTSGSWTLHSFAAGFTGTSITPGSNPPFYFITQPDPLPGSFPVATNPIPALWSFTWTPVAYSPSLASLLLAEVTDVYPKLFARIGMDPQGNPIFARGETDRLLDPPISILIAPAPPIASPLLLALFATRRPSRVPQY